MAESNIIFNPNIIYNIIYYLYFSLLTDDFENAMMLQLFTDDCDMFRTLPYIVDELCCHTNPILRDLVYRRDADKIPRNHTNIENIVATYTDLQFKEHFRMNRFTFEVRGSYFYQRTIVIKMFFFIIGITNNDRQLFWEGNRENLRSHSFVE